MVAFWQNSIIHPIKLYWIIHSVIIKNWLNSLLGQHGLIPGGRRAERRWCGCPMPNRRQVVRAPSAPPASDPNASSSGSSRDYFWPSLVSPSLRPCGLNMVLQNTRGSHRSLASFNHQWTRQGAVLDLWLDTWLGNARLARVPLLPVLLFVLLHVLLILLPMVLVITVIE